LFCFRARGSYLNQIIREGKFVDGFRRSIRILEDQLEPAMIERSAGRLFNLRDSFAQSLLRQFERAMVAVRIVSGATEENARGPRATGFTHVSVVATATETPQLFTRSATIDVQFIRCPPDIFKTEIANIPARIF